MGGQVKEIKNEEKWGQYLEKFMNIVAEEAEKKSGNFVPTASSDQSSIFKRILIYYIQQLLNLIRTRRNRWVQ